MAKKNYGIRLEPDLKEASEAILRDYGFNLADGVRIFLKQVVNRGELPIELKRPNSTTLAAMKELEESTSLEVQDLDPYIKKSQASINERN